MNFKIQKPELTSDEFIKHLIEYFPKIKDEVLDPDYADLIHLQIGLLANYANDCIENKKFDELQRIFDFFKATINKVDSETENALYVSFLEHVEFRGLEEKEIKKYLNPNLFEVWRELRG